MDIPFLRLEPGVEMDFPRPFNQNVKQVLQIKNVHPTSLIAFKVKTTAPKQYCVRPNAGVVQPGQVMEVQVILQGMREEPPAGTKCKDKFLVQSIKVPQEAASQDAGLMGELWSAAENIKKTDPAHDEIIEKKLKCNWLDPVADTISSTPTPRTITERKVVESAHQQERSISTQNPIIRDSSTPVIIQSTDSISRQMKTSGSTVSAGGFSNQAIDEQLQEAVDTIKNLKAACDGYKYELERRDMLRQRRGTDDKSNPASATGGQVVQQGFTAQVVAIVALISFFLGWFFF